MKAPITDKQLLEMMWERFPEIMKRGTEQPAQQQEPVAWLFQHEETGLTECVDNQQVEWGFEKNNPLWQKIAPLYTSPPAQRKPLTDEQIMAIGKELGLKCRLGGNPNIDFDYARAIEAAHGIKE